MTENFEFISVLERIATSVKEFIPQNILIEGELPTDLETFIGNDFTQKFDKFLQQKIPSEEYLKIELALSQSSETEWFLKYHDISDSILSSIEDIGNQANSFSTQYLRDLDYSELTKDFGGNLIENTEITTENAVAEIKDEKTFEEVLTEQPKIEQEVDDIIEPIVQKQVEDDIIVSKIEEPVIENVEVPVLKKEPSAPVVKTYSISDDDDDKDLTPVSSMSIIDKVVANPPENKIEEPIVDTVDIEAMRNSYNMMDNVGVNDISPSNPLDSVRNEPKIITTQPIVSNERIVETPKSEGGFALPKLGDIQSRVNGLNFGMNVGMLLNKKVMIGIFVILVIIGSVLYPKYQKDGTKGVQESVQSITSQVNSTVGKVDITKVLGTSVLEYTIFSEGVNRTSETDSKRTLTSKTVNELNTFLSDSLLKLRTSPENLQKLAGMTIRIFSVDGKKTLTDITVKDFVLKRRK